MNSQIVEIQKRIELRSKKLRSDYLNKISFAAEQSQSARKNMGCRPYPLGTRLYWTRDSIT